MQKWLQKILVPFAFMVALGHNVFPHHHHEEITAIENHHHDDDDHDKNPFSFKFLDHLFFPNQAKVFTADDFLISSDQLTESNYQPELIVLQLKKSVIFKNEFPPPSNHNH